MSKYTTEVRYICEVSAGKRESEGFSSIETILTVARRVIFDFDYPIFDENYRSALEKKILRHYYTREICEETVGLWKLRLCDKLNMIMPYYNQLYLSELIKFNPLYDVDISRSHSGRKDNQEDNTSESINTSTSKEDVSRSESTESRLDTGRVSVGKTDDQTSTASVGNVNRSEDSENSNNTGKITTGKTDGKTTSNETSAQHDESNRWDKYSETPQGAVTGLEADTYLTNARKINDTKDNNAISGGVTNVNQDTINTENGSENSTGSVNSSENTSGTVVGSAKNESTNTVTGIDSKTGNANVNETSSGNAIGTDKTKSTNTVTGLESYIERVSGKQGTGSYSKMLMEFRETFLNIDAMIIEELSDLFFGLW